MFPAAGVTGDQRVRADDGPRDLWIVDGMDCRQPYNGNVRRPPDHRHACLQIHVGPARLPYRALSRSWPGSVVALKRVPARDRLVRDLMFNGEVVGYPWRDGQASACSGCASWGEPDLSRAAAAYADHRLIHAHRSCAARAAHGRALFNGYLPVQERIEIHRLARTTGRDPYGLPAVYASRIRFTQVTWWEAAGNMDCPNLTVRRSYVLHGLQEPAPTPPPPVSEPECPATADTPEPGPPPISSDEVADAARQFAENPGTRFAWDMVNAIPPVTELLLGEWNPLLDALFELVDLVTPDTPSWNEQLRRLGDPDAAPQAATAVGELLQGMFDEQAAALAAATALRIGASTPSAVTNAWIGYEGERITHKLLRWRGFQTFSIQNRSNHGIDILAIKPGPDGPRYFYFEVKTSRGPRTPRLSGDQRHVREFITSRLQRIRDGGHITDRATLDAMDAAILHIERGGRIGAGAVEISHVTDPRTVNILIRRLGTAEDITAAACASPRVNRWTNVLISWLRRLAL